MDILDAIDILYKDYSFLNPIDDFNNYYKTLNYILENNIKG